jgi:hypothetical protein
MNPIWSKSATIVFLTCSKNYVLAPVFEPNKSPQLGANKLVRHLMFSSY